MRRIRTPVDQFGILYTPAVGGSIPSAPTNLAIVFLQQRLTSSQIDAALPNAALLRRMEAATAELATDGPETPVKLLKFCDSTLHCVNWSVLALAQRG